MSNPFIKTSRLLTWSVRAAFNTVLISRSLMGAFHGQEVVGLVHKAPIHHRAQFFF